MLDTQLDAVDSRLSTDVCCSDDGSLGSRDSDPFLEFHHFDDEDFEVISTLSRRLR